MQDKPKKYKIVLSKRCRKSTDKFTSIPPFWRRASHCARPFGLQKLLCSKPGVRLPEYRLHKITGAFGFELSSQRFKLPPIDRKNRTIAYQMVLFYCPPILSRRRCHALLLTAWDMAPTPHMAAYGTSSLLYHVGSGTVLRFSSFGYSLAYPFQ